MIANLTNFAIMRSEDNQARENINRTQRSRQFRILPHLFKR